MKNIKLASPADMSPSARAGEITAIFAAAIVRTLVTNEPHRPQVGLGFLPEQSVHTTPYQQEKL